MSYWDGTPACFNPRAREGRDPLATPRKWWSACFNPRAREGRDRYPAGYHCAVPGFNPRAREGRDFSCSQVPISFRGFQSTRPRGARHGTGSARKSSAVFQSTRPRGARPSASACTSGCRCFNPRAREGRDVGTGQAHYPTDVSIHAPARGATSTFLMDAAGIYLFQSTRPRGARPFRRPSSCSWVLFQSTRPRGARPFRRPSSCSWVLFQSTRPRGARRPCTCWRLHWPRVSIHAPARGATGNQGFRKLFIQVFQSTRPRGARPSLWATSCSRCGFQSTRPRGARQPGYQKHAHGEQFQSTRPRGARPARRDYQPAHRQVSIHAPARGATSFLPLTESWMSWFQSTRPRGARHENDSADKQLLCFNPRAREGRDVVGCVNGLEVRMFQSTRPRGARPRPAMGKTAFMLFQSTRPRGARRTLP